MATASTTTSPPAAANLYVEPDGLPETYSMHVDGDCMEPIFSSGMRIVVDSAASYRANDIVVLFQNPRVVKPGRYQVLMKRLVQAPPHGFWNEPRSEIDWLRQPAVIAAMFNPRSWLYWRPQDLLGIHKVIGLVPPEWGAGPVPREIVIPIKPFVDERMDSLAA